MRYNVCVPIQIVCHFISVCLRIAYGPHKVLPKGSFSKTKRKKRLHQRQDGNSCAWLPTVAMSFVTPVLTYLLQFGTRRVATVRSCEMRITLDTSEC